MKNSFEVLSNFMYFYNFELYKHMVEWFFLLFVLKIRSSENMFLLFFEQIKGWDGLYRIEETTLVCAFQGN